MFAMMAYRFSRFIARRLSLASLVRLFSAVALIRISSIERVGTAKARAGRPGPAHAQFCKPANQSLATGTAPTT